MSTIRNDKHNPTSAPKRKQKNVPITPYIVLVAAIGVVAFSVATFSIYGKLTADITIPANQTTPNSPTNDKLENPPALTDKKDEQKNEPKDEAKDEAKDDKKDDGTKDKDTDNEAIDAVNATPASLYNVLTGKNLDDILAERTGISGMNVIPVSSANKPSDTEKDKDKTDKDKTDKDKTDKDKTDKDETDKDKTDKDKTDKDETDKDKTDKDKTDKDNTDKSPENPSVDTAVEASGANAVSEKKPYEPKYSLETLGSSGAENISYWKTKNSDVIGWLRIPNTNIDFPVVVGPDSLYYNERGYGKETSKNGVIWADSATNFGTRSQISQNTVLYGHNWTNYSPKPHIGRPQDIMFAQLTSFHHLDFAKNTPYIYYSTESEEMVWKVFASLYTETKWNYLEADAGSAYMQSLISKAKTKSMHNYNVDVNANDKILTLSTCTRAYGQRNDQRFVVMARLVRKGEAIDEVSVTENPNFETPQF